MRKRKKVRARDKDYKILESKITLIPLAVLGKIKARF